MSACLFFFRWRCCSFCDCLFRFCSFSTSTCIIILFTLHLLKPNEKTYYTRRSHLHNMFKCFAVFLLLIFVFFFFRKYIRVFFSSDVLHAAAAPKHFAGWACLRLKCFHWWLLHFSVAFSSISVRHCTPLAHIHTHTKSLNALCECVVFFFVQFRSLLVKPSHLKGKKRAKKLNGPSKVRSLRD